MTKTCCTCKQELPLFEFYNSTVKPDGKQAQCISCKRNGLREWRHKNGIQKPASQNRTCPSFLGVHVAERVLSGVFKNVKRSSYGTKGYDFVCGKGFKVDVKSSTMRKNKTWSFTIKKNTIADYFALLAFDSLDSLNPLYFWLIPGSDIQNIYAISISKNTIIKLKQYEKPVDKVISCCNAMKTSDTKGL